MDERSDLAGAAGWYPDPHHRFEYRWFNGRDWTADVSTDGHRFVDQVAAWGDTWAQPPSRVLAVLAFVFGLGGLLIAWTPFLFVIGALGAITALVLGIVGLRRIRRGQAAGRGLAIVGMICAGAALGLCVVGFVLTRAVVREFDEYMDPGPVEAVVTACTADGLQVVINGTVHNLDDREHDYVVVVDIEDGRGDQARSNVRVDDVAAGESRQWDARRLITRLDADTVQCELVDVDGPYPFGLPEP